MYSQDFPVSSVFQPVFQTCLGTCLSFHIIMYMPRIVHSVIVHFLFQKVLLCIQDHLSFPLQCQFPNTFKYNSSHLSNEQINCFLIVWIQIKFGNYCYFIGEVWNTSPINFTMNCMSQHTGSSQAKVTINIIEKHLHM